MLIGALDIETIPSQILPKELCPKFDPADVKLGQLKDPYKIELKIADEKKKFDESLNRKMATDPALCQACTFVGYFYNTSKNEVTSTMVAQWPPADNEYDIVYKAWDFMKHCYNGRIPLVSFNGKHFDLPVLLYRAMLLDIPIDHTMYQLLTDKWKVTKYHYDLMQILIGGPYPEKGKNFDFHLRLFDLGEKTVDMNAALVYEKWLNDEHDVIRAYCEDDVLGTCRLFARCEPWIIVEG